MINPIESMHCLPTCIYGIHTVHVYAYSMDYAITPVPAYTCALYTSTSSMHAHLLAHAHVLVLHMAYARAPQPAQAAERWTCAWMSKPVVPRSRKVARRSTSLCCGPGLLRLADHRARRGGHSDVQGGPCGLTGAVHLRECVIPTA